jgi:hypothetical protein
MAGGVCCVEERPAIWWSPDGLVWRRSQLPEGVVGFVDVAAGPDGFVAATGTDLGPAMLVSADGLEWLPISRDALGLEAGAVLGAESTPDGWIAIGKDDPGRDSDGAVWTASALDDWRRVALEDPALTGDDEVELTGAVVFDGGILVTGGAGTQEDRKRCEELLVSGALFAGPLTGDHARSCGWLSEAHWLSADGSSFERTPEPGPRQVAAEQAAQPGPLLVSWRLIAAGGPGLVLVGTELLDPADPNGTDTIATWQSVDGRTWSRVGADQRAFVAGDTVAGIALQGRSVIAVGEAWDGTGPSQPTVWLGLASL